LFAIELADRVWLGSVVVAFFTGNHWGRVLSF